MLIGRVFDVDDILLNILGGISGFLLYYILYNIWSRLPKIFKNEILLDVVAILILVGLFMLL